MPRALNPNNYHGWKKLVSERDGHKCILCGSTDALEVHHIKSYQEFPELRYVLSNGQLLCHDCHVKTHRYNGNQFWRLRENKDSYGPS